MGEGVDCVVSVTPKPSRFSGTVPVSWGEGKDETFFVSAVVTNINILGILQCLDSSSQVLWPTWCMCSGDHPAPANSPAARSAWSLNRWARDNFLASQQRQPDNVIQLQYKEKYENVKDVVSQWSSHNKYGHNAKINNLLA